MKLGTCHLCERGDIEVTDHHLIPRTRHNNKKTKDETTKEERNRTAPLCRPCHSKIHVVLTEKEMEREYNTLDKLKSHPEIIKFIEWVSKRSFGRGKV